MDPITIDLTGVQTELEALEPGNYPVQLGDIERRIASTGSPMLVFIWTVTEPEEAAGRKLYQNHVLLKQSLWTLKRTLLALGADRDDLEGELQFDPGDWIGEEALAVVTRELRKGPQDEEAIPRNNIERILPTGAQVATASGESLF